jgi:hypothetical protein
MKSVFFFGFSFSWVIAWVGLVTQQEFLAWSGTISAGISIFILGMLPLYSRWREAQLKADIALREARKSDTEYSLQCAKELINDLNRRIATLERECREWQSLYAAGSRDYKKLE